MPKQELTPYERRKAREIRATMRELGFTLMPYVEDKQILDNVRTASSLRNSYYENLGEEPDFTQRPEDRGYNGGFQLFQVFKRLQRIGVEPPQELLRAIELRVDSRYAQHPDRDAVNRSLDFQSPQDELSDGISQDSEGNVYLNGTLMSEHTRETLISQIQMIINTPAFIGQNQKHYDALERFIEQIEQMNMEQVAYLYRLRSQIQITGDFYDSDGSQNYVRGVESIEMFIVEAIRFNSY